MTLIKITNYRLQPFIKNRNASNTTNQPELKTNVKLVQNAGKCSLLRRGILIPVETHDEPNECRKLRDTVDWFGFAANISSWKQRRLGGIGRGVGSWALCAVHKTFLLQTGTALHFEWCKQFAQSRSISTWWVRLFSCYFRSNQRRDPLTAGFARYHVHPRLRVHCHDDMYTKWLLSDHWAGILGERMKKQQSTCWKSSNFLAMKINIATFRIANRKLEQFRWRQFCRDWSISVEFIELRAQAIATIDPESGQPSLFS